MPGGDASLDTSVQKFLEEHVRSSQAPHPWVASQDQKGRVFFVNNLTNEASWVHPLESRDVVEELDAVCRQALALEEA